ncbi:MAG: hypothetical protein KDK36_17145 [Leptospiraceae bacterium]|nr:hypothetical protein [Leptospiraceae bacterium]
MKILGLHKDPWHNTGAAIIVKEGEKVSFVNLAEERCNREKDSRKFPIQSTKACMKEFGIKDYNEFDLVVIDYIINGNDWKKDYLNNQCDTDNFLNEIDQSKIVLVNHHLCHAHNTFYSSGFQKAAILIVDGRGSERETQSLYLGDKENGITLLDKTDTIGIGLLYSSVTLKAGFKILQEGKTMGLAPYGKNIEKSFFKFERNFSGIITDYSYACVDGSYETKLDHPEISTFEDKAKVSYEVQQECEAAMFHLAKYAKEKTGADYLCISGGVGLNSVANNKILKSNIFKDIYINPEASDTGIPLGAALYGLHKVKNQKRTYQGWISPYIGPTYSKEEIISAVEKFEGYKIIKDGAHSKAADLLSENKILGVFHGRSEMGPRALGNRSIIMSPLKAENKDILNSRVKFRESFRPFAPAILKEYTSEYFDFDRESPFMLMVPDVKEDKKNVIPAVTHVDGTGRLQTVSKELNENFYSLIENFYKKTGVPVLLNTSFNVNGEPIVETPEDAIKCFLKTSIDALLVEDILLVK